MVSKNELPHSVGWELSLDKLGRPEVNLFIGGVLALQIFYGQAAHGTSSLIPGVILP